MFELRQIGNRNPQQTRHFRLFMTPRVAEISQLCSGKNAALRHNVPNAAQAISSEAQHSLQNDTSQLCKFTLDFAL